MTDHSLAADLDAILPNWEANYEPGNVSDYLIALTNSEAAAKGAAIAWLQSESDIDPARLEWVEMPTGDRHDRWYDLIQNHDDGIPTDTGINVRHRPVAGIRDTARTAAGQPAILSAEDAAAAAAWAIAREKAAEETHIVADDSSDPEHVDDCPGCEAGIEHDEHCPTPETHNWGCGCPTDKWPAARARDALAGYLGSKGNDPSLALLLNNYHSAVARQAVAEHAAAGQSDAQQQTEPGSVRNVIEHALTVYYQDSSAPSAIARALLAQHRATVLREAAQSFTSEAEELDRAALEAGDHTMDSAARHSRLVAIRLSRMADEAAQ